MLGSDYPSERSSLKHTLALREKCSYSEFFLSMFSRFRSAYGEIRTRKYGPENTDQKNSEYGHFSHNVALWKCCFYLVYFSKMRESEEWSFKGLKINNFTGYLSKFNWICSYSLHHPSQAEWNSTYFYLFWMSLILLILSLLFYKHKWGF